MRNKENSSYIKKFKINIVLFIFNISQKGYFKTTIERELEVFCTSAKN